MNRLDELLLLWQDQTVTPEELAELKTLLANPEGRASVAADFFLTGVILESLRVQTAAGDLLGDESEPAPAAPIAATPAGAARPGLLGLRPIAWWAVIAASLLVATAIVFRLPKPEPATVLPPAFAQVEGMQGEIFVVSDQQLRPAQMGEVLVPGQGIATEGPDSGAVVQMNDAVRLKLGGDTRVLTTVEADQPADGGPRLVLEKGDLLVEVTRSLKRKKMTVQTDIGSATAETEDAALHLSSAAGVVVVRGEVTFRHKETGKSIRLHEGEYLAMTPERELYASQLFSGSAHLWTTFPRTGLNTNSLGYALAFSPDGTQLAAVNHPGDGGVRVGAVRGQDPPRELRGFLCVKYSPDGKWLATADQGNVLLYDLANGGPARVFATRERKTKSLCLTFSPDGQLLAVGRAAARGYAEVEIWDAATGTLRLCRREHLADVTCVAFSPDGSLLASGSLDRTVILWDMEAGRKGRAWLPTRRNPSGRWHSPPRAACSRSPPAPGTFG